jgi:hypothetical protein
MAEKSAFHETGLRAAGAVRSSPTQWGRGNRLAFHIGDRLQSLTERRFFPRGLSPSMKASLVWYFGYVG